MRQTDDSDKVSEVGHVGQDVGETDDELSEIIIIIIIIKKNWQCKAGRGIVTPYQSEDPSPTLPTYRGKEEKGKIVEDEKGENN